MMDIKNLHGCGTALVTPFLPAGQIDDGALEKLVHFQIEEGINFLVPCGTTGESATMTKEEHLHVIQKVVEISDGRVPVIGGAGGYDTLEVTEMAKRVQDAGVDAILSVTPYYNKPTQEGLYQHFRKIAKNITIPLVLYNVPSRTSVNMLPDTIQRLSEIDNITAVKEASGDIAQVSEIVTKVSPDFRILSGNDDNAFPLIAVGGHGLISVISNLIPKRMTEFVHLVLNNKMDEARVLQKELFPLFKAMFLETNPIPVKAALTMIGKIQESYRLPLTPLHPINASKLKSILESQSLI